jgi:hypothetical protein
LGSSQLISRARSAFFGSAVYWPTILSVTSLTQAPSGWVCCSYVICRVAKLTAWRGSVPVCAIGNDGIVNIVRPAQLATRACRSIS